MATSESTLWEGISRGVSGHWVRIESLTGSGIPDVNFSFTDGELVWEGWMELKNIKEWPKRESTKVDPGVTTDQVRWGGARTRAGGCWLLCIGTPEGLAVVLRGSRAARAAGKGYTRGELLAAGDLVCAPGELERKLMSVLNGRRAECDTK